MKMSGIKLFNEITEKYQKLLDESIGNKHINKPNKDNTKNNVYTYETIISPIIEKYSNELNKNNVYNFIFKHEFKNVLSRFEYNIIVETLSKHLSYKHFNIPLLTRLNIYHKYPLLIQCLLIKNDRNNVISILNELLKCEHIELIEENLKSLLNYCENFDRIVKNESVLSIYNGFNGIEFKNVSLNKTEFEKNKANKLIINIGYNVNKEMNNVIYKDCNYNQPFVSSELLSKYKPRENIVIQNNPTRYEFKKVNNGKYLIAINYNDNYYSTTDVIYDLEELEMFNNGSLLHGYNNFTYLNYISELFYTYNDLKDKNEETCEVSKYLGVPLKTFYNKNPVVTINKWKEFCDNDKLIFENQLDKKCFKIYISKLSSYVDENNELELYKYISYISNYFLPDVE